MAALIYALCALTSAGCAVLLGRAYRRGRVRLVLWCAIAFSLFAANNALLFVDLVLVPSLDMSGLRTGLAAAGVVVLLVGLVWDSR